MVTIMKINIDVNIMAGKLVIQPYLCVILT